MQYAIRNRVNGLVFDVWDLGFGVWGLGFEGLLFQAIGNRELGIGSRF
jgi:hypothetical protein